MPTLFTGGQENVGNDLLTGEEWTSSNEIIFAL